MFGSCTAMGIGGWTLMIGLWAAFLGVAVWTVVRLFPTDRRAEAATVLDERFAAGEIDTQTYRAAREELAATGRR